MKAHEPLLAIHVSVDYRNKPAVLRDIALDVHGGEIVGLVGHSGCGKSTLALAIPRLLHLKGGKVSGTITFKDRNLQELSEREMRRIRGREIGLVLQSPLSALNPHLRIGTQLREAWYAHADGDGNERIRESLESVALPCDEQFLRRFPSQLSVGQGQRVLIAMAILHKPALLIADEPTSALDAITQAEVLQLFQQVTNELGTALLYISHDLPSVASICHRIAILHDGMIVECGERDKIFTSPEHPYTKLLTGTLQRLYNTQPV